MTADVVVVGLGPAGRALAHRCSVRGLDVVAVDPHPDRRWTPTYAAWSDELPGWLPDAAVGVTVASVGVWTARARTLARAYTVLDTPGLQQALTIDGVRVVAASATRVDRTSVTMSDGRIIKGSNVVDARGLFDASGLAEQTAFGLVVDSAVAEPILDGAAAWFMDWRSDNGAAPDDQPSFLYAVPTSDDRVLLEETCLVGRPALDQRELAARLRNRLAARSVGLTGTEQVERVRFAVEAPKRSRRGGATAFGSRGGMLHPGTGYSVAASLTCAEPLAAAIANGHNLDHTLWPARTKAIAALRAAGLRTLLDLDPTQVVPFFDAFFELPLPQQRAYLSQRTNFAETAAAMGNLFRVLPADLRRAVTGSSLSMGKYSPIRALSTIIE
ncbi:lycopene cyclase family protein [Antrihabitans cavernicola]|uniref:Lycopene cyclase n=1 Tax=Antrihabitans cavernicola TaxID=2495913 RepID=A0A5A7SGT9_9NOCA|nr:lycopene cyclase family protein [Spelaeibacter cavernicola]KAA0023705.1 lycopene cyclase [Spelaeibacter cavernicola]